MAKSKRNRLLARIHIAKKSVFNQDENYRNYLRGKWDIESTGDVNDLNLLEAITQDIETLVGQQKRDAKFATGKQLAHIKGLWKSVAKHPTDSALDSFCERVTGIKKLEWLKRKPASNVIQALYRLSENHKNMRKQTINHKLKKQAK